MKTMLILTAVAAAMALGACRHEAPVEPLKLGGPAAEQTR